MPGPQGEADEIMAMSASAALALTDEVKAGRPEAVRRAILYGSWKKIKALQGVPEEKKAEQFRGIVAILGDIDILLDDSGAAGVPVDPPPTAPVAGAANG